MIKKGLLLLSSFMFCLQVQASVGFRQLTLSQQNERPLNVAIWYPALDGGVSEVIADNAAFVGVRVDRNALPMSGVHPVLVISHGYNGNWRNLSWIAEAMAQQGYIVAAPDHPGTTTFDQNPVEAKKLWRRPQDMTRVIDFVIDSPRLIGKADQARIAALGHSLGGWTVLSLAGAQFYPALFLHNCRQHLDRGDCTLQERLGVKDDHWQQKPFAYRRDPRIKAVVSLDLGLAPGFSIQSLRAIPIPVLLLAAGNDRLARLPSNQESGYIAEYMDPRRVQFKVIEGATHFSFMQVCKAGAEALIEQGSPGDGIVCHDGNGMNRAEIHQRLIRQISKFLNSSLNYPVPVGEITSEIFQQSAGTPD